MDVFIPNNLFNDFWEIVYAQKKIAFIKLVVFIEMTKEPLMVNTIDGGQEEFTYFIEMNQTTSACLGSLDFEFEKFLTW